jgi:hypothetical protein
MYGEYRKATGEVSAANTGIARGFADAAGQARILGSSLDDAINKGQTLTDVWNELNGAMLSSDEALLAANNALTDVAESFKKNGKAIDGSTSAALANRIAVGQAAEAAAKAAQAKYEETGSISAANDVYQTYIANLRKVLHNAGLTNAQIDELIKNFASMPPSVTVGFDVPGLNPAVEKVDRITRSFNALNGRVVTTTIITNTQTGKSRETVHSGYRAERWGGIRHAADGLVSAGVYSGGPLYAFAEPETAGEAFIPRRGDYGRSTGILDQAARWYGGRFVAGGGGGGNLTITLLGGDGVTRALVGQFRAHIQGSYGGNVQLALGQ